MTNVCGCGCGQAVSRRFVAGHNQRLNKRPIEERFWEKVDRGSPDQCWEWRAAIDTKGYGNFTKQKGKFVRAHRFVLMLAGQQLTPDVFVCHTCDNRRCVNPKHLFVGTALDNVRDMMTKGRHRHPSKQTHCKRGHEYTAENSRVAKTGKRSCRECDNARRRVAK